MESTRTQNGQTERINITALNDIGDFVTELGITSGTLLPTIEIRRESDDKYLDFNDNTFKSSGWSTRQQSMTELDSTNNPGVYYYNFNTTGFNDDNYFIRVLNDTAYNAPWEGQLKVGGFIDNIDVAISSRSPENEYDTSLSNIQIEVNKIQTIDDNVDSILTDTNEMQGKLPTNNIMGSSDKSDKDDEIDAIKTKTDNLPTDPADQSEIETAIATAESNIRGTDNDTLKIISEQLDVAQNDLDNPDQYKADVSELATEANATANTSTLTSEINANETKIDAIITTLSTLISDIWSYATRSLTTFGSLTSDVWSVAVRTITAIGGSGIASESNATTNKNTIVSEINSNETKIDIIDGIVDNIKIETDKIQTIDNNIDAIQILVNRVLGLQQENFRILNPIYNDNHLLTSATIRIYSSASDCTNDVTPIASYTVTVTYNDDNEMLTYKVIKN